MKHYNIATILFYTDDLRIVIQDRRSMSKFGEEWGFFGGSIEKEETPEQSIVREVKEELCYNLENFEKIGQIEVKRKDFVSNVHIFIKKITQKEFDSFNVLEGDGAELIPLKELKKRKMMLGMGEIIDLFMKKIMFHPYDISIIIFHTKDNMVLMQNRKTMSKFGEEYGCFGGKIEKNETPEQAIFREIKEELDYDLVDCKYLGETLFLFMDNSWYVTFYVFTKQITEDEIKKFKILEGDSADFFTLNEAKKLIMTQDEYDALDLFEKSLLNKSRY